MRRERSKPSTLISSNLRNRSEEPSFRWGCGSVKNNEVEMSINEYFPQCFFLKPNGGEVDVFNTYCSKIKCTILGLWCMYLQQYLSYCWILEVQSVLEDPDFIVLCLFYFEKQDTFDSRSLPSHSDHLICSLVFFALSLFFGALLVLFCILISYFTLSCISLTNDRNKWAFQQVTRWRNRHYWRSSWLRYWIIIVYHVFP